MPRKRRNPGRGELRANMADPQGFGVLATAFLDHLEAKNYSPGTITSYREGLQWFLDWAAERGLTRPDELT